MVTESDFSRSEPLLVLRGHEDSPQRATEDRRGEVEVFCSLFSA
jgi:hypothetical protein